MNTISNVVHSITRVTNILRAVSININETDLNLVTSSGGGAGVKGAPNLTINNCEEISEKIEF